MTVQPALVKVLTQVVVEIVALQLTEVWLNHNFVSEEESLWPAGFSSVRLPRLDRPGNIPEIDNMLWDWRRPDWQQGLNKVIGLTDLKGEQRWQRKDFKIKSTNVCKAGCPIWQYRKVLQKDQHPDFNLSKTEWLVPWAKDYFYKIFIQIRRGFSDWFHRQSRNSRRKKTLFSKWK